MSHVTRASYVRIAEALRSSWNQARLTDRELMVLRTNLTRHVG